jgi:DNA-3-methyladenine glycosylase II
MVGEYTYKPYEDGFSFLVNQIIGQMLSAKVASKISERLILLCGGKITPQSILALDDEAMRKTGMSLSKANYIKTLSKSFLDKEICFEAINTLDDKEVIKELTKIKGIGVWTVKMYLIFVLDRKDVLPYEDAAFLQSYSWLYKTEDISKYAIEKRCKKWKPYSSIGARYLYKALDMGLTKDVFHLYK